MDRQTDRQTDRDMNGWIDRLRAIDLTGKQRNSLTDIPMSPIGPLISRLIDQQTAILTSLLTTRLSVYLSE